MNISASISFSLKNVSILNLTSNKIFLINSNFSSLNLNVGILTLSDAIALESFNKGILIQEV